MRFVLLASSGWWPSSCVSSLSAAPQRRRDERFCERKRHGLLGLAAFTWLMSAVAFTLAENVSETGDLELVRRCALVVRGHDHDRRLRRHLSGHCARSCRRGTHHARRNLDLHGGHGEGRGVPRTGRRGRQANGRWRIATVNSQRRAGEIRATSSDNCRRSTDPKPQLRIGPRKRSLALPAPSA